jgi:hypothetical protein
VVQKQSTHSELYFCVLFHFDTLFGCRHKYGGITFRKPAI